jgi:predicted phage gp36 major capsid-like protein
MGKYEEDRLLAQIEQLQAERRQRDHDELMADVARREQEAQQRESAMLLAQLAEHSAESERIRRSRWTLYVTRPDSPDIERLIAGSVTMEDLIPAEGYPPGEAAADHERPAPHIEESDPPPLVVQARQMGLDI